MKNINIIKHKRIRLYTEQTNHTRTIPEYYELEYISNGELVIEFFDTLKEVKQLILKQTK